MVGREAVPQHGQDTSAFDIRWLLDIGTQPVEEWWTRHVRALRVPGIAVARRHRQRAPFLVAVEDGGVVAGEDVRSDALDDDVRDLLRRGPDLREEDGLAVGIGPAR